MSPAAGADLTIDRWAFRLPYTCPDGVDARLRDQTGDAGERIRFSNAHSTRCRESNSRSRGIVRPYVHTFASENRAYIVPRNFGRAVALGLLQPPERDRDRGIEREREIGEREAPEGNLMCGRRRRLAARLIYTAYLRRTR